MKDPYKTLGVNKEANQAEIKKAYYQLAKKYHPDQNKDPRAREKFQEIQAAYEILSDANKRAQLDQYGPQAFDTNGGFQGFSGAETGNPFADFGGFPFGGGGGINFEDLFSQAFGGRSGGGMREVLVGGQIDVNLTLTFMEAALGSVKAISINPIVTCKQCKGSGLKQNTKRQTCSRCGGSGTRIHNLSGGFQMASTCEACGGAGTLVPRGGECPKCDGEGVHHEKKTVTVHIPAGVSDGMRVRVAGEGDAPRPSSVNPRIQSNGKSGDLFVHLRIQPHPSFRRQGPNIYHTATIPMTTAALGGTVNVPTLEGTMTIKVPQGTTTGDTITLGGQGIVNVEGRTGSKGDYNIDFKVSMPKSLGPYERNLLEQLATALGDKTARRTNDAPIRYLF